ncbi:segregation and condensation protein [Amylolactobacillus amylotrophicus DSM 20534]|uniref:Segregation and condensation protein A n=3 Tax=Amylolactobacillus TaxID=2767876 RepID=A0A1L6XDV5_9LACO|nr:MULTISPECIES: segregation/condensation protein A [Amylolactobacillus]APT19163.1 segregation and condensation protein A [Amylolactobacillus amylophilus DSM 20533 = JCM 1125]KRK38566.1 segregation and condensation protein [Amylolactobacillus amylotrophicus DSM 20534]KRM42791.1 segregation and condensation protein [Amylolactobacillus amylophilus DSM 20533 = JCM 1125]GED79654.1 segregation and condensation protein A [Amylolactobacillus amylophilus]
MDNLELNLPNFEGPLDLLLHLIKSQKIDIYDIPIAQITQQYLSYLNQMKRMNLNLAGEYFVLASTLLRIKSSVLLPKNDFVEGEYDEDVDPRQELVDQLLQYELFQKVAVFLKERDLETPKVQSKEPTNPPDKLLKPLPVGVVTSTDLSNTFAQIMQRYQLRRPQIGTLTISEASVEFQVDYLKQMFEQKSSLSFFNLIENQLDINYVVGLFLAVLELVSKKFLIVIQHNQFADLILQKNEDA